MRVLRLQKYSAKPLLFHHFVSVVYFSYIHFQIYLPSHLTQNSQSFARIGFLRQVSGPVEVCLVWLPLATSLWLTHVQCRSQLRVLRGRFCNVKPAHRIVPVDQWMLVPVPERAFKTYISKVNQVKFLELWSHLYFFALMATPFRI